jgi:hypothetical protein
VVDFNSRPTAEHTFRDQQVIVVKSISGRGDVLAFKDGVSIIAECKGGIVNTRHSFQISRLRKGCARQLAYSWPIQRVATGCGCAPAWK